MNRAETAARETAGAAGVRIVEAHDAATMHAVDELFGRIWHTPAGHGPVPVEVLRSIEHAGGAVHVAHAGDNLVGAAAALFCPPAERAVYSMIAGAGGSDRGVGFALKQAQRLWALGHGALTMRWTFDPLVSRNARFNLVKLGAIAGDYSQNFYGAMSDGVQGSDESDRFTAQWRLDTDFGRPSPQPPVVDGGGDAPDGGALSVREGEVLWLRVPVDIVALRRDDPAQASAWRSATREVLAPATAQGYSATGITRDGWYRMERI